MVTSVARQGAGPAPDGAGCVPHAAAHEARLTAQSVCGAERAPQNEARCSGGRQRQRRAEHDHERARRAKSNAHVSQSSNSFASPSPAQLGALARHHSLLAPPVVATRRAGALVPLDTRQRRIPGSTPLQGKSGCSSERARHTASCETTRRAAQTDVSRQGPSRARRPAIRRSRQVLHE